jgi:glycosyltransferase involved in cell wall biosynthesis
MDDVPAGPASPEPRRPGLSVVIPVHNGGRDFEHCLRRLRDSYATDFELLVIDDGSTDGSGTVAEAFGARVIRQETAQGPAAARNAGAKAASAPIVFFLDADVAVHPDTVGKVAARFANDPGLTALFGSYDDCPSSPGLVSQYRNLLHHFVHQQGEFVDDARPAKTFWTGCGAIRKSDFIDHGGFDPGLYRRPAIEDIELGYRLTRSGCKIILARDIQATHMKRWTLRNTIKTDIFQRGVPWMLLIKRSNVAESDLNVKPSQRLCVALAGLMGMLILAAPFMPLALGFIPLGFAAIMLLNRDFYAFLSRVRGPFFAVRAVPLHYIYYCCCGLSVVIAMAIWYSPSQRKLAADAKARDADTLKPHTGGLAVPPPNERRARKPSKRRQG